MRSPATSTVDYRECWSQNCRKQDVDAYLKWFTNQEIVSEQLFGNLPSKMFKTVLQHTNIIYTSMSLFLKEIYKIHIFVWLFECIIIYALCVFSHRYWNLRISSSFHSFLILPWFRTYLIRFLSFSFKRFLMSNRIKVIKNTLIFLFYITILSKIHSKNVFNRSLCREILHINVSYI